MEKHVYLVSAPYGKLVPQDTLKDCLLQIADQLDVEEGKIILYVYGTSYQDVYSKQLCVFTRKNIEGETVIEFQSVYGDYIIPSNEICSSLPNELCKILGFIPTDYYETFSIEVAGSKKYIEKIHTRD